jgi:hypothetical protein
MFERKSTAATERTPQARPVERAQERWPRVEERPACRDLAATRESTTATTCRIRLELDDPPWRSPRRCTYVPPSVRRQRRAGSTLTSSIRARPSLRCAIRSTARLPAASRTSSIRRSAVASRGGPSVHRARAPARSRGVRGRARVAGAARPRAQFLPHRSACRDPLGARLPNRRAGPGQVRRGARRRSRRASDSEVLVGSTRRRHAPPARPARRAHLSSRGSSACTAYAADRVLSV